jgi:formate dehydrogenase iron-sulfur subunit
MAYAFFIDTTVCTGCRGCQVACKQWHDLPAEETKNRGSYQNPPDLSFDTYKLVHMAEEVVDGRLQWLFFPEQCRHCIDAPCLETAGDADAIYKDEATGAILYTALTKGLAGDDIIQACPYNVPRKGPGGVLAKCDMCNDRIHNGRLPACVKTCPTGAMNFGPREEMVQLAQTRLAQVKAMHPKAILADPEDVSVIYLVAHEPKHYFQNVVASAGPGGMTRQAALQRMLRPFSRAVRAMQG